MKPVSATLITAQKAFVTNFELLINCRTLKATFSRLCKRRNGMDLLKESHALMDTMRVATMEVGTQHQSAEVTTPILSVEDVEATGQADLTGGAEVAVALTRLNLGNEVVAEVAITTTKVTHPIVIVVAVPLHAQVATETTEDELKATIATKTLVIATNHLQEPATLKMMTIVRVISSQFKNEVTSKIGPPHPVLRPTRPSLCTSVTCLHPFQSHS